MSRPEGRLQDKIAVVTGSTGGIGRGIALVMVREGAKVVICGRRQEQGVRAAEEITALGGAAVFQPTDLTVEDDCRCLIERARQEFGGLDILVNNAGIFPRARLEETTQRLWEEIMAVNLRGPFFCCKYAVPLMRERGGGAIINVGSVNAYCGQPNLLAYAISKGGLLTMTHTLARALARDRIRVNWVTVGWVASEGEIALHEGEGHDEQWLHRTAERTMPLGRMQTEEEIAHAVVFLASDEGCQITGTELDVDGGFTIGR